MRVSLVFIIVVGLWGCSRTSDNKAINNPVDSLITPAVDSVETYDTTNFDYGDLYKLESYLSKMTIENEKLETVDFDCAILIYPTVDQIKEMKKAEGEDDFYVGADDSSWYQAQAIDKIDSMKINKISAEGHFLRLKGQQKTWDLDIRKMNLPAWNLIFFKTTKEPIIVSTVDLTIDQVKDYFEIRE